MFFNLCIWSRVWKHTTKRQVELVEMVLVQIVVHSLELENRHYTELIRLQ